MIADTDAAAVSIFPRVARRRRRRSSAVRARDTNALELARTRVSRSAMRVPSIVDDLQGEFRCDPAPRASRASSCMQPRSYSRSYSRCGLRSIS